MPLSARLPGSARKLPATTAQQQQQLLNSKLQDSSGSGIDLPSAHRLVANNIVAKPQVPQLNMGRHEGSFGSEAATARPAGGPGSLPHIPQHRAPSTSRPAFASSSQQSAGTTERPAAAAETGPITPAQALKRYGEYLSAFEQSEVLQYQQVGAYMQTRSSLRSWHVLCAASSWALRHSSWPCACTGFVSSQQPRILACCAYPAHTYLQLCAQVSLACS